MKPIEQSSEPGKATVSNKAGISRKEEREFARADLAGYMDYTESWEYADHLLTLCDMIHEVEQGNLRKLMVFMPPRHGKSEIISRSFPSWYLGRNPRNNIILTSYSADLAYDFSRVARNKMRDWSEEIFGKKLAADSSKIKEWNIADYGGGLKAAGVGGSITGKGADVAIIDDPVKNWQDAQSKKIRKKNWEWYQSTLYTRLAPEGSIVLVMTRWHKDDLAGKLLDEEDDWTVLRLKAIADKNDPLGRSEGEALWPERFDKERLEKTKTTLGSTMWRSLYQQEPPEEIAAALWSQDQIQHDEAPNPDEGSGLERIVVSIDPATTNKDESDETGIVVVGVKGKDAYVLDDLSLQASPQGWASQAVKAYHTYGADRVVAETNQGGDMVENTLRQVDDSVSFKQVHASRGKQIRAEPVSALYEQGRVYHTEQFDELEDQLCSWVPGDDSPDRMDALVWALTELVLETPDSDSGFLW